MREIGVVFVCLCLIILRYVNILIPEIVETLEYTLVAHSLTSQTPECVQNLDSHIGWQVCDFFKLRLQCNQKLVSFEALW